MSFYKSLQRGTGLYQWWQLVLWAVGWATVYTVVLAYMWYMLQISLSR